MSIQDIQDIVFGIVVGIGVTLILFSGHHILYVLCGGEYTERHRKLGILEFVLGVSLLVIGLLIRRTLL